MTNSTRRWQTAALFGGLFLFAMLCRAPHWRQVFTDRGVILYGADPYYHVRRAMLAVVHFPRVPEIDPYCSYPEGERDRWPPLMPFVAAAIARAVSPGMVGEATVRAVSVWFCLIVASTVPIPVFLIARRMFDTTTGIVAGVLVALLPANVDPTLMGRVDHHVAEATLSTLFAFVFLMALDRGRRDEVGARSVMRRVAPTSVAAGLVLALLFLFWTGAALLVPMLGAFAFAVCVWDVIRGRRPDGLMAAGPITFWTAAVVMIPWYGLRTYGRSFELTAEYVSWFQPLAVFGLGAGCLVLGAVARLVLKRRLHWSAFLIIALVVPLVLLGIAVAVSPSLRHSLAFATYVAGHKEGWYTLAVEMDPLMMVKDHFVPEMGMMLLSTLVFTLPFVLAWLAVQFVRGRRGDVSTLFLIVWAAYMGYSALNGRRFAVIFAAPAAVLCAYLLVGAGRRVGELRRRRAALGWLSTAAGALVLLIAFYPCLHYHLFAYYGFPYGKSSRYPFRRYEPPAPLTLDAMTWLRDNTPPTSGYLLLDATPEYGVLAANTFGHSIITDGRRPASATPFGGHLEDFAEFLLATTEAEANAVMDRLQCRYVMIMPFASYLDSFARVIGRDARYAVLVDRIDRRRGCMLDTDTRELLPAYYRTMASRLFTGGSAAMAPGNDDLILGVTRYRSVYEANDRARFGGGEFSSLQFFEYVTGARLIGRAAPGADVHLQLSVQTNVGRQFLYRNFTRADAGGQFTFTLPYATANTPYATRPIGLYRFISDGPVTTLSVDERDVQEGRTLRVDLTAR